MTRLLLGSSPIDKLVYNWLYDVINKSVQWQDEIFFSLCASYALVSIVALIQLVRIHLRVPQYGWTTQKVFNQMNFIANGVGAIVFEFHKHIFLFYPNKVLLTRAILDLQGLLFFSTFTILILFWAEIYHQATNSLSSTYKLRISYFSINGAIYLIQACIYIVVEDNNTVKLLLFIGRIFIEIISFIAALGFLIYSPSLYHLQFFFFFFITHHKISLEPLSKTQIQSTRFLFLQKNLKFFSSTPFVRPRSRKVKTREIGGFLDGVNSNESTYDS
ncbi:tobamovirus multiplication protein 1-like [Solanum dulcamara]|uniref:tobamovirus multiplication protein 1-like n=1 Tax=Solanum dulcamara TaxID=45834 RepID=UPI002485A756|nr:tobamovirus multiplication protein 1-like [Solanum dulcamara]